MGRYTKRYKKAVADAARDGIKGIPSDIDPDYMLTYDGGRKLIPRDWYDKGISAEVEKMFENMSPEEEYAILLRAGLPRVPRIEAGLDMNLIKPELLDNESESYRDLIDNTNKASDQEESDGERDPPLAGRT